MMNRRRSVVSLRFLQELALVAGYEALAYELAESEKRSDADLYTEAILRLGRATEASVYAAAGEFEIDPTLGIPELANLQRDLAGTESLILKSENPQEVDRCLRLFYEKLERAADCIRADFQKSQGEAGLSPRGTSRVLKDIHLKASASHTRRKAERTATLLRHVMRARNSSAHAAPDGRIQKIEAADFDRLYNDGAELIVSILLFVLGRVSHKKACP